MQNNGVIRDRAAAAQIRNFSGLRWGNITPTDIDGLIEYQNRLFVFIEAKYMGANLPHGQRLALERLCDAVSNSGKMAVVFIASHETPPDEDIDFTKITVIEYRYRGKWVKPPSINLKSAIDLFIKLTQMPIKAGA